MNKSGKIILVTGATGHQGGATARHLLANGWSVRCLCRDPNKPAARELAKAGAQIVKGNLDDRKSVDQALKGCYGLFSVQTPVEEGIDAEIQQGITLADAAKAAGIQHTVYSSVAGCDKKTGIPFFDSKVEIESHIKQIKLPTTILRPVFFMENFDTTFRPTEKGNTWVLSLALRPDKPLQMISVDDIGTIAATVFDHPEEYLNKTLDIAADEVTLQQVATLWSRVSGKTVKFEELPLEQLKRNNPGYAKMFDWFNKHGYTTNIAQLRSKFPKMHRFEQWLTQKHAALTSTRR